MLHPGKIDPDQGHKNVNLETWSGLTAKLISKHIAKSEATIFGHLDQRRKNTREKSEHLALELKTGFIPVYLFMRHRHIKFSQQMFTYHYSTEKSQAGLQKILVN